MAFNQQVEHLIREVRLEKPVFQTEIDKEDLLNSYIVYVLKKNSAKIILGVLLLKRDGE